MVELLDEAGVGERLHREGLVHHGIELQFAGERHRIPLSELTGGRTIVDLRPDRGRQGPDRRAPRQRAAAPLRGRGRLASTTSTTERPRIRYRHDGAERGARVRRRRRAATASTGSAGRASPPASCASSTREYPFGWLGILAAVAPSNDELVYAHHERGFALLSLRSPELSRLYLQCRPDEDLDEWPDDRIWEELQLRLGLDGWTLAEGPILEKGVTGDAQLRRRADAVRAPLPRGGRGAHRAADRREGPEPRDRRRAGARRGARRTGTATGTRRPARRLLRDVPAPRLAGGALLVVDDARCCTGSGRRRFDLELQLSQLRYLTRRRPPRRRWRRTTSGSRSSSQAFGSNDAIRRARRRSRHAHA